MTPSPFILTCAVGALTTVGAMPSRPPVVAQDTIRRTLRWSGGGEHTLEVSNVNGSILRLCTINHGAVTVEGVEGDFDVSNVNGRIDMTGIRGSGRAETVNGRVNARFAAVRVGRGGPEITFEGVNGDVHVLRGDN